jgi:hypothetical protein
VSDKPLDAVGFDTSRGVGKHDFVKSSTTPQVVPLEDIREPFWGHCSWCSHEWVIFYAPMDMLKIAEITKKAICPACGDTKIMCGKKP